jgi:hypothetical protein
MKSEEIRAASAAIVTEINEEMRSEQPMDYLLLKAACLEAQMLGEIAAQLAQMNERAEKKSERKR